MSVLRSVPMDRAPARARGSLDSAFLLSVVALPIAFVLVAFWWGARPRASSEPFRDRWRPRVESVERTAIPSVPAAEADEDSPALEAAEPALSPTAESASDESSPNATPVHALETLEGSEAFGAGEGWSGSSAYGTWGIDWDAVFAGRRARWMSRVSEELRAESALRATLASAFLGPSAFESPSSCGPFACRSTPSDPPPVSAGESPTTARSAGSRWTLANRFTTLTIDRERACRIETLRVGALSPVVFDPTDGASADACSVREQPYSHGIALELTWRGPSWTGRAVVSLDDAARDPEATVARVERAEHGDGLTELVNLGRSSRAWTVNGRTLSLAPGRAARIFEPASAE